MMTMMLLQQRPEQGITAIFPPLARLGAGGKGETKRVAET